MLTRRYGHSLQGLPTDEFFYSCAGYIYPDTFGDPICDMYKGVPCTVDPSKCCYNVNLWCPSGGPHCDRYDRGAYPWGDKAVFADQMFNPEALSPFPNAIVWNWATIFVLGFGNLGALDFQARCLAGKPPQVRHQLVACTTKFPLKRNSAFSETFSILAKTPKVARLSCLAAGCLVLIVAVPFAYMGAITRYVYEPVDMSCLFRIVCSPSPL
jgi:hypothetical protein